MNFTNFYIYFFILPTYLFKNIFELVIHKKVNLLFSIFNFQLFWQFVLFQLTREAPLIIFPFPLFILNNSAYS